MNLAEKLNQALVAAMKEKQADRLAALRLLLAAVKNKEIEKRAALTDEDMITLLKTEAKKRQASREIYQKAGRQDLAEREALDLKVIEEFLSGL